jgi:hypothetical protein
LSCQRKHPIADQIAGRFKIKTQVDYVTSNKYRCLTNYCVVLSFFIVLF